MCKFMSAIWTRGGDLLCDPRETDSHEVLVAAYNLRDEGLVGAGGRDWCRIEFTPPEELALIGDVSKWILTVDESATPEWYDADRCRAACEARVERMIVRDDRACLLGGPWIILAGSVRQIVGRVLHVGSGADLADAYLARANLARANLADTNLAGAYLAGASLARANLAGANLARAILADASLAGADLTRANLTRANLTRADLAGADLTGANLTRADLADADLTRAYLTHADLADADLRGANLTHANLAGADPVPVGWVRSESGLLERAK